MDQISAKPLSRNFRVSISPGFISLFFLLPSLLTLIGGTVAADTAADSETAGAIYDSSWAFVAILPDGYYFAPSPRWYKLIDSSLKVATIRANSYLGGIQRIEYSVYLVESASRFDSLVGEGFPHWGAAVAIPSKHLIIIKAPELTTFDRSPGALAAHEFAHLSLSHIIGRPPPRWLDEGFAMYVADEGQFVSVSDLALATLFGSMIDLEEIDKINSFDQKRAQLGYSESYLAFQHLFEYYGPEAVRELCLSLRGGATIDEALMIATGADLQGFQDEVFEVIKMRYGIVTVLIDSTLFWGLLALLIPLGYFLNRMRRKKRYEKWERDEALSSTDFDYGDPRYPEKTDDEDHPWN
ncbi:MAG: hypothetical protein IIB00_10200 [candidate division Zixibacteria bacterium]|nr:hypothetical protein [candidate division Zixibacteria bacterium]